ncbi:unnamed protein product [Rhizophagus irregularis]|uniref:Uncharacterized protein n=1 Tax=Rhizophagus irregularis TaxID=588596 RepID=A0A915ZY58_9GLOM|nr:unnamed protein product [Rhizophagus irregularis]
MSGRRYWMDGKERMKNERHITSWNQVRKKSKFNLISTQINSLWYALHDLESTNINKFESINGELFQLYRTKFTRLKGLNDKIDNCKRDVEDLTDLTKNIPRWLVKLQNEKVPRVFVMIPDQKIGKNQFFYTQGTILDKSLFASVIKRNKNLTSNMRCGYFVISFQY